ncbi:hypothetical protein ACFC6U_36585 [Kitasatospora purpeofusca]|uniref:hypothetical protein n=1 Tax=Kitasatospora purpeofusca TaxID=67352 RepID=UPI0035DA9B24
MTADLPMSVLGPGGVEETWELFLKDGEVPGITLRSSDGTAWSGEGNDLFDALSDIRLQIEPLGYLLLCNGARTDAYPSGMCRDMGRGSIVYILQPGRAARRQVSVFDRAAPASVGTVAAQREFYEAWIAGPLHRPLTDRTRDALAEVWFRLSGRSYAGTLERRRRSDRGLRGS